MSRLHKIAKFLGTMNIEHCQYERTNGETISECRLTSISGWTNTLSLGFTVSKNDSENVGSCRLQRSDGWFDDGDDDDWDDDWDDDEDNDDENDNDDEGEFGVEAHSHGFINIEIDDEIV